MLPVAKRKSRRAPGSGHFLRKVCKKVKKTRATANSASSGALQSWVRAASYKAYLKKTRFFEKNVFFSQNTVRRYLVGAGLSGSLSCCHFLCKFRCVNRFFEIYAHSNSIRNRFANLLRRVPRTSFFCIFFGRVFGRALYKK